MAHICSQLNVVTGEVMAHLRSQFIVVTSGVMIEDFNVDHLAVLLFHHRLQGSRCQEHVTSS